jgi:hypothetical protein
VFGNSPTTSFLSSEDILDVVFWCRSNSIQCRGRDALSRRSQDNSSCQGVPGGATACAKPEIRGTEITGRCVSLSVRDLGKWWLTMKLDLEL